MRSNKFLLILILLIITSNSPAYEKHIGIKKHFLSSWKTEEFNNQWGLDAINANYAYYYGYTGKDVPIGVLDAPIYKNHPEFTNVKNIINLVTKGKRAEKSNSDINIKVGDNFYFDGTLHLKNYEGQYESHGTSVASIIAGNRDGKGMHGVAFNAKIFNADIDDGYNTIYSKIPLDRNIYYSAWQEFKKNKVRIINNSWGIGIPDAPNYEIYDSVSFSDSDAEKQFNHDIKSIIGTKLGGIYNGAIDLAHNGIIMVYGVGNDGNTNSPNALAGLPYFLPNILSHWVTVMGIAKKEDVTRLLRSDFIYDKLFILYENKFPGRKQDEEFYAFVDSIYEKSPNLIKEISSKFDDSNIPDWPIYQRSNRCGYTASFCVAAPADNIYSANIAGDNYNNISSGYRKGEGTSLAAPHVSGAIAILMERFPYLSAENITTIVKTTANDLGKKGIDEIYGWGLINLREAINGPKMFISPKDIPAEFYVPGSYTNTQFVVNIPGIGSIIDEGKLLKRICLYPTCAWDIWRNDITGHGGLTKEGSGTLVLTGNSTYRGPTLINNGILVVNGTLTSDVLIQKDGVLSGNGTIGSLSAHGTVAPGNSIGTLNVNHNVNFEPGSRYVVEVGQNVQSDRIQSSGAVTIDGGEVVVSLENKANLLSRQEGDSRLGHQYIILSAQQGVSGQFDRVASKHLFLSTELRYHPNQVTLSIGRNNKRFSSVAQTQNEREVANAADELSMGNPVYESILTSSTVDKARQAYRQLSGQINADIVSALVNNSRYLSKVLNGRLRQAKGLLSSSTIKANESGVWAQSLMAWEHASGNANATGYQGSTYGILFGFDSALATDWLLGIATGYTRTSLHGGYGSNAGSNNYHLAAYGNKQFGLLALCGGAIYTWHRIDTSRLVNYGVQSEREMAKYSGRTQQLFAEMSYRMEREWVNLEPFVNLAYINMENNQISEHGNAAALRGNKQHYDATVSMLGWRVDTERLVNKNTKIGLFSELGWQHQYGQLKPGARLRFKGGNAPFVVNSVPISRDRLALKVGLEVVVNKNAILSLSYDGLLSQQHQDNSVNAVFTWRF